MKSKIFNIFRFILIFGVLSLTCFFITTLIKLDILPSKYYWTIIVVLALLNIISIFLLFTRKKWTKVISMLISLIVTIFTILGISYGNKTLKFFNNNFDNNGLEVTKYDVIVLKDSKYKNIEELLDKNMGYLTTDEQSSKSLAIVKTKVNINPKKYDSVYDMYEDLLDKKVDSILIDEAYLDLLKDDYSDVDEKIKIIDSFDIESMLTKDEMKEKTIKTSKDNINIYISGSDSRSGKITDKSRSDVNMIMTINPKKKTILLTSIPRDYYVKLHGTNGSKDKLTHSGVYGIDISKKTIEDLFDIEIDYTIKVGFKSVINLVDLVGGIDIESDKSFTSLCNDGGASSVEVKKGMNHFNGAEALSYARERYAYQSGDRHRIQNQQQVLEAVIKKLVSDKTILLNYEEFLTSFGELYRTDISDTLIRAYIKEQLNTMSSWKIEKQWVDGAGEKKETYTMPGRKLYVMVPNEESLDSAKEKINELLKDK